MISPVWFDTAWRVQDCVKHEKDWEKEQDRNIWTAQKDLIALETNVLKFSFKGIFQGYFLQRFAINSAILQTLKTLCSIHPQ